MAVAQAHSVLRLIHHTPLVGSLVLVSREGIAHLLGGGFLGLGLHGGSSRVGLALEGVAGLLEDAFLGVGLVERGDWWAEGRGKRRKLDGRLGEERRGTNLHGGASLVGEGLTAEVRHYC